MKPLNDNYNPTVNSKRCWELALKAAREQCIRRGFVLPDKSKPEEVRWATEGVVPPSRLEAVRG